MASHEPKAMRCHWMKVASADMSDSPAGSSVTSWAITSWPVHDGARSRSWPCSVWIAFTVACAPTYAIRPKSAATICDVSVAAF